jgi:hypothetical protein
VVYLSSSGVAAASANHFWDNANSRLGIGTTSPSSILHVRSGTSRVLIDSNNSGSSFDPGIEFRNYNSQSPVGAAIYAKDSLNYGSHLTFSTKVDGSAGGALNERMRITSAGNVGIGTETPGVKLDVAGAGNFQGTAGTISWTTAMNTGSGSSSRVADITFFSTFYNFPSDTGQRRTADITAGFSSGVWGTEYMAFGVGRGGADNDGQNVTLEKMRISSAGYVGINNNNPDRALNVTGAVYASAMISGGAGYNYPYGDATSGLSVYNVTYLGSIRHTYSTPRSSDTIWFYTAGNSTYNNQLQAQLTGSNGNFYTRGSFTGGGADYAELFEWADGNPDGEDRVGYPVVLVDDKIVIATENSTDIIGIVSHNPTVVGDSSPLHWQGKYLKDDFGRPVYEEHARVVWDDGKENHLVSEPGLVIPPDATYFTDKVQVINPLYDENIPFVPREDRKEWAMVGLVGKIYMRKTQPKHPNWKCMKRSVNADLWFVK